MNTRGSEKILIRSYSGDKEQRIVEFLNLCYGAWGDLKEWKWRNVLYPTFESDNIVLAETGGKIVGYGALFFRDLYIPHVGLLRTATLGDAAVHPKFRGRGLYSRITYETRMPIAKSKGAGLLFLHTQKGSVTHKANKKRGFVEVHYPVYIKVINAKVVLEAELKEFVERDGFLRKILGENFDLDVNGANITISLKGEKEKSADRTVVRIVIDEKALALLVKMRASGKARVMTYLAALFISRAVKLKLVNTATLITQAVSEVPRFVRYLCT